MPSDEPRIAITPETTLGDLLQQFPRIESLLDELSPTYRALTNPAIRRTASKVTTVRQLADADRLSLGELIGKLRCAAGLEPAASGAECSPGAGGRPAWAAASAVTRTFDARAVIQSGGHPLPQVMGDLAMLKPGQVYELVTPFVPAPLVDIARAKGFEAYSSREQPDLVRTYFSVGGHDAL